ncbi:MAG: DUF1704 domain-containing protein, partial [Candidatus Diapherotrites archaeon]|nr:DUF1704 domain-containing protein [Candidatus Diapherotrites archaeon]
KKKLASIETDDSLVGRIFEMRKTLILKKIELIQSIGTDMLTEYSLRFYGKPKPKEKKFALKWIKLDYEEMEKTIAAEKAAEYLLGILRKFKLYDWKVTLDNNLSSDALIVTKTKEIILREKAVFSKEQVERLSIHEIQSHAFRHLNGLRQELKIFAAGISEEAEKTDEGLAVANEELFGLLSNNQKKIYAARLLAADYALEHSFYETFKYLTRYLKPETAYKITQRVKRGLIDTSKKGAFTKDIIYLRGFLEVKKFLEHGGKLEDLYIGKVSIEELKIAPKMCKLKKPIYLPNYQKANKIIF